MTESIRDRLARLRAGRPSPARPVVLVRAPRAEALVALSRLVTQAVTDPEAAAEAYLLAMRGSPAFGDLTLILVAMAERMRLPDVRAFESEGKVLLVTSGSGWGRFYLAPATYDPRAEGRTEAPVLSPVGLVRLAQALVRDAGRLQRAMSA